MNDMNNTPPSAAVFDAPKPDYGTRLSLYHANGKNTGMALQLEVEPATPDRDGSVFLTIAKQKTVGNLGSQGPDRFASFDWANKTTVKLGFLEVAEILMVFGGQAPSLVHAGKDGLYHNSAQATTSVSLKRAEDPERPGYILGVGRTPKADPNARQFYTFAFRPSEAFALRAALTAEMGLLAFGLPRERRSGASAPALAGGAYAPPPAAPAPFAGAPAAAPAPAGFGDDF